ncbi:MAG: pirin family protein [Proteobacteria bacterium]|nr:pirin family protein [Pseudomonadota bacterium]
MMNLRKSDQRGKAEHGWLSSRHTFSFADYFDREHMGFRQLRVINEDHVAPGRGFPTHSHRDMEIISYVLDGALEHKDSTGTSSVIVPGDVQRMSAGTGVAHSEFNHSQTERVHFLQIWLLPETRGVKPSYEQKQFSDEDKRARLCLVASRDGRAGSVTIQQDADLYATLVASGDTVVHPLAAGRHAWIQVARGGATVTTGRETLQVQAGDGVAICDADRVELSGAGNQAAEILLFDLA